MSENRTFTAAMVQMRTGLLPEPSLAQATRLIRQADVQGRRIVLVDDVLTSGATLDACARALLRAKAAQVDVLVFARVVESR